MNSKRNRKDLTAKVAKPIVRETDHLIQDSGASEAEFARVSMAFGFNDFWDNYGKVFSSARKDSIAVEEEFLKNANAFGMEVAIGKAVSQLLNKWSVNKHSSPSSDKNERENIYLEHLNFLENVPCKRGHYKAYATSMPPFCADLIAKIARNELKVHPHQFVSLLFHLGRQKSARIFEGYEDSKTNKIGVRYQHVFPMYIFEEIFREAQVRYIDVGQILKRSVAYTAKSVDFQVVDTPITNGATDFGEYTHLREVFKLGVK